MIIHPPVTQILFPPWQKALVLRNAGYQDDALVYFVYEVPYSCPSDPEVASLARSSNTACTFALDENLYWARMSTSLAEQIIRLLKSGRLAMYFHIFKPNSPKVLTGHRAKILPLEAMSARSLFIARRQPAEGFRTPHHFRGSLVAGPNANIEAVRRLLNDIETGKLPYYGAGPAAEAVAEPPVEPQPAGSDTQGDS